MHNEIGIPRLDNRSEALVRRGVSRYAKFHLDTIVKIGHGHGYVMDSLGAGVGTVKEMEYRFCECSSKE
jgi:hypothetical protein